MDYNAVLLLVAGGGLGFLVGWRMADWPYRDMGTSKLDLDYWRAGRTDAELELESPSTGSYAYRADLYDAALEAMGVSEGPVDRERLQALLRERMEARG